MDHEEPACELGVEWDKVRWRARGRKNEMKIEGHVKLRFSKSELAMTIRPNVLSVAAT